MRTEKEIKKAIEKLNTTKNSLPEFNIFGENNHLSIDEQIFVLENNYSFEEWEEKTIVNEDDYPDSYDNIISEVDTAIQFLNGEVEIDVFDIE